MTQQLPPPGWYQDPADPAFLRYWDGGTWTEHRSHPVAPSAVGAGSGVPPTGKQLLRASLALFRQNRRMLWLPVLSGVTTALSFLVVTGLVAIPLLASHTVANGRSGLYALVAFPGMVVANFIAVFFNVALVFAANEQMEGRPVDIGGALRLAWQRRRVVFTWALLSATVGTVIRAVEQRLGVLGRVVGILGGLAWAVATFMVIPVLAFEDLGPIAALKQSSHLLTTTFGTIARGALRFGMLFLAWVLLAVGVMVAGGVLAASGAVIPGIVLGAVGVVGLFVVGMYAAAAGMYLRTILYRYATGRTVPDLGFDLSRTFNR